MALKALVCPQCGGPINRDSYVCEYCGTQFKRDDAVLVQPITVLKPGTKVLTSQCCLTDEVVSMMGAKEAAQFAIRQMAMEMADQIAPMMDVVVDNSHPFECKVKARLRILEPTYRF